MSSSNFFPISSLRNDANESSDALSSSSEEKGEVYQKLHKKVSNFVIVKKRKEALEKEQSELKKCLAKLEEYRKKNKLLDFQRKAFFDVFSLHDDADINQINNKAQEAKNKISLLNSISNELDISQTEVFNPNEIYSKFISLKGTVVN
ncbi:hypothetical protein TRFO_36909 [Tritrichomonas foetus]|uniref:Uncharacterized protein n=1 Tax=Tritrichomonas foetus TaxID=1144522 RepID=A0A1J4JID2_9EUKA|nr:hypothetical protein TRFO_36909 [Tritrichomonas foetus]|eukprot:OHS96956.1 hypothetical protein TRFO_36909 [Tritrichomonas foetus]